MKFSIRDDDLNYFSSAADISTWYDDLFKEHIPVGFSAIPFVRPESDVYTGDAQYESREYAIGENAELVSYVRSNPCIEVLQHGTTHQTIDGVFEYARLVDQNEVRRGKGELERAFSTEIGIFVPPHDWINSSGVRSAEYADMHILRGRGAGLRNWLWRPAYALRFLHMALWKTFHAVRGWVPAYPYVLDFGNHKEVCSYRLEDTDVFRGLEYAHQKNGIFVVVTHLHYFTPEKKARLLQLIARARELKAEFVPPSQLFTP